MTDHNFTRATVWDPATGVHEPAMLEGFNIFCSGLAHLMNGSLFTAGGNKNAAAEGIRQTLHVRGRDQHLDPRRRHGRGALVPDRDPAARR